ncbi:MAG: outer membrane protein transport protein [Marinobacter sp.]|uniref:OmpP1/FadL family transporter n=1 Tax=Marinobacter sp. TaxID=50741 RepID=UPI00299D810B|nr:outer membrane protein transport protein [Marinobacter sp.]MDX1635306.1 outer membrane protein transport protein [Marinobacter sp.]
MQKNTDRTGFRTCFLPALLVLAPASALAGGYALNEQGAAASGVANAGAVANPENASTVYFNPAGMTELEGTQVSFGAAVLDVTGDFEGSAVRDDGSPVTGNDGGDFVPSAVVPNLYLNHKLNDNVAVGFGLNAPYGLTADYNDGFVGRFFADETDLTVVSFSPALGFTDNEGFSGGFSVNVLYAEGTLSKFSDFQSQGLPQDGYFEVEGDDVAVNYTFGIQYQPVESTRFGLVFRTETELDVEGDATLTNAPVFGPTGPTGQTQTLTENARVPLAIPEQLTFGVSHKAVDTVTLLASVSWTRWSRFESLDVLSTQANAGTPNETISFLGEQKYGEPGVIGHVPEQWKDTWSAAVGTVWQATPAVALRAGYAFDESPVNEFRTARVPSEDRHWITLGGQYAHMPSGWTVDLAAGYLIIDDPSVDEEEYTFGDNQPTPGAARLTGEYELDAWGAAIQLSKTF